jgi:signal transduction histidine kinase
VSKEIPVSAGREPLAVTEVARLEALRRLAMGAAHALNNAFTAVVGEASLLQQDRKLDPEVAESCQAILSEMNRCSRITKALLSRPRPPQAGVSEVDLVRLVRDLGGLLRETLGSQNQLELRFPDDLLLVDGDAASLEVLVLTLVHYAADEAPGATSIDLSLERASGGCEVCVSVAVSGAEVAEEVIEAFVAPERSADALTRAQLEAVAGLVASHGGRRMAERSGAGRWVARVALPALD